MYGFSIDGEPKPGAGRTGVEFDCVAASGLTCTVFRTFFGVQNAFAIRQFPRRYFHDGQHGGFRH